jgi:Fe-S oxidoreductase
MGQVTDFLEQFDQCLANEPAFCTAKCPFRLDVREFTARIEQGRVDAAYKLYRDAVGFPAVVSELCDKPCESACPLKEADSPIAIRELERFVVAQVDDKAPNDYNLPSRGKRVAVVGAGLAGLGCALRLATKKYQVEVFEASEAIGGSDWHDWPATPHDARNRDRAIDDIALQFRHEAYTLHLNRRIASRTEVNALGFDAVFVATGVGGLDFGLVGNSFCLLDFRDDGGVAGQGAGRGGLADLSANAGIGWFAGGALIGQTGVFALANGLSAGAAVDAFLRTGNLLYPNAEQETKMVLAPFKLEQYAQIRNECEAAPTGAGFHAGEAARCLKCRCDACMLYADLPAYAGKWPIRIRDEVFATTLPGKAEVKATPARRLINTGNLSGAFEAACPVGIDLDGLLLAGRQSMHRQEKMPWAFHEFHLRDMAHADSEAAALTLVFEKQNGGEADGPGKAPAARAKKEPLEPARYAFFPGCQLGAGNPRLPEIAWNALKRMDASGGIRLAGLILRCCGAPAEWAGDEALLQKKLEGIRVEWERLEYPTLALACPSCMRLFEKCLPDVETVSLYEILQIPGGKIPGARAAASCEWAVFDACAAARLKNAAAVRKSVRGLAQSAGVSLRPLPVQDRIARCCGFGGQPDLAAPTFARQVVQNRLQESALPYICYCMNCRDAFVKAGKPTKHILEILFPEAASDRLPTVTERRENRARLRAGLAAEAALPKKRYDFELEISEEHLAQMDQDKILAEDVFAVVAYSRKTGRSIHHAHGGRRSGCLMIGKTTYWVDVVRGPSAFGVCNAGVTGKDIVEGLRLAGVYSHRIAFEPEVAWNAVRRWVAGGTQHAQKQGVRDDSRSAAPDETLVCEPCGCALEWMEAEFSYLGRSFRHKVMRCPECGMPYIPEDLARGRMRIVEMALEEK